MEEINEAKKRRLSIGDVFTVQGNGSSVYSLESITSFLEIDMLSKKPENNYIFTVKKTETGESMLVYDPDELMEVRITSHNLKALEFYPYESAEKGKFWSYVVRENGPFNGTVDLVLRDDGESWYCHADDNGRISLGNIIVKSINDIQNFIYSVYKYNIDLSNLTKDEDE